MGQINTCQFPCNKRPKDQDVPTLLTPTTTNQSEVFKNPADMVVSNIIANSSRSTRLLPQIPNLKVRTSMKLEHDSIETPTEECIINRQREFFLNSPEVRFNKKRNFRKLEHFDVFPTDSVKIQKMGTIGPPDNPLIQLHSVRTKASSSDNYPQNLILNLNNGKSENNWFGENGVISVDRPVDNESNKFEKSMEGNFWSKKEDLRKGNSEIVQKKENLHDWKSERDDFFTAGLSDFHSQRNFS